ncbi:MAG: 16S rRNA (uracil(1498)-N(3))-methyltransferase, partial [Steroidobacteraceae bacterium]|nr:16S rRNA (uracil(1498)-N(3))-methyltransferase [Steroidobacteraceae bacterium]MDW8259619.1 RsmE family RNA methyltransferase [Gammaproteobacteria bacterium]
MRLTRVYVPGAHRPHEQVELPSGASDHLVRVLRLRPGAELQLFNGEGRRWHGRLTALRGRRVTVSVGDALPTEPKPRLQVVLLQSLLRTDKMDWVVQKTTELGVSAIYPVLAAHTVVRADTEQLARKVTHWRGIAIAACEQSGRAWLPCIAPPCDLESACRRLQDSGAIVWALEASAPRSLA